MFLLFVYCLVTNLLWFDIKMDFSRKARFVAEGHTTEAPASVTYSSVEHMNHDQISLELRKILNVILVSYPDDVKKMFQKKSVVNALFHVGKYQNKHEQYNLKDHQISYILIRKMLDYCIANSPNWKVSPVLAKQAYTKFVGDPKGEKVLLST